MNRDWARRVRVRTAIILLSAMCIGAIGVYRHYFPSIREQEAPQAGSMDAQGLIARGCILDQTLHYAVCGHEVERKMDAPDTVLGMNRELFTQAMSEYRITSFGAQRVEMARTLEMACPAHWVIQADADGLLGVYRNLYGEEMVCLRRLDTDVTAAPESDGEALRRGMCFDTAQEADAYLEAIQS